MLESGRELLHYRLVEKIGEGGMGIVWKAVDTSLDREVAIKVLAEAVAADSERLERFEREAKLLATLSHPNIAIVHGLHETGGMRFLAMELADGEDLAQRLARGPVSVEDAVKIGRQIAEALEAAHDSGVIHRDLKPANVQLGSDGSIKVLDFGLAKAFEAAAASGDSPSMSPTMTSTGTKAGVILGTAAYMSPEQAKGAVVDKRADVWAFGCVMLEMLSGRQVFRGESIAEMLASVIKEEPDWSGLPSDTPPQVRRLLRRCLAKDPRERLRDLGDARIVLAEVLAGAEDDTPTPAATSPLWLRILPWALTAMLAVALVADWGLRRSPAPSTSGDDATAARLSMVLPDDRPIYLANLDSEIMLAFAVSPSGDRLVYSARDDVDSGIKHLSRRMLHLRDTSSYQVLPVRGTEGAEGPFFSPDGRWIGFFDGAALRKIPAAGGAPVTLAEPIGNSTGASWGEDGTIVFAYSYVGPLWAVSEEGGEPRAVTALRERERSHRFPHLLPDGKSVLFTIKPTGILSFDDGWIAVADLDSGEHRILLEGGSHARYVDPGFLVYARASSLLAAPFDLETLEITGGAVPVLDGVMTNPVTGAAMAEIADDGTLVWVEGDYSSGATELYRVERDSGERRRLAEGHYVAAPRLSPDERYLVMHGSTANDHVLRLDLERGTATRMTDGAANDILPIWGHQGERIIYSTDASGAEEIVSMPAEGGKPVRLVAPWGRPQEAYDVSPDGSKMTINRGVRSARDIYVLDPDRGADPVPFLATSFDEGDAIFSPDGQWIAYTSDESGVLEVYASPYPSGGRKIQLSTGGGYFPRFRGDGGELYYQTNSAVVAVPLSWSPSPRPGGPRVLFDVTSASPIGYDVTGDGRRFYMVELDDSRWESRSLNVILNWSGELARKTSE